MRRGVAIEVEGLLRASFDSVGWEEKNVRTECEGENARVENMGKLIEFNLNATYFPKMMKKISLRSERMEKHRFIKKQFYIRKTRELHIIHRFHQVRWFLYSKREK